MSLPSPWTLFKEQKFYFLFWKKIPKYGPNSKSNQKCE